MLSRTFKELGLLFADQNFVFDYLQRMGRGEDGEEKIERKKERNRKETPGAYHFTKQPSSFRF